MWSDIFDHIRWEVEQEAWIGDEPIYSTAHFERVATRQASKKEIGDALQLLQRDPLVVR